MIRRPSWLDQRVYRFQHRWETNPQYRAAVAGVCGLLLIILMCSCTGILATVTNAAFASSNSGSADSGNSNTGTQKVAGAQSFPTYTIVPNTGSTVPAGNIPDSQTPPPGPTATPTDLPATPTDTPGGGGGGPPLPTTCNGGSSGGTWAFSACPMIHSQPVTLSVSDPRYAGRSMYVVVNFGSCNNCTWLLYPSLNGNGYWAYTGTVPAGAANSQVPVGGEININNGPVMGINAAPVQ